MVDRIIAEITDYPGLLDAFRTRFVELQLPVSGDTTNDIAGLPNKYVQKLVGARPVRRIGMTSLGALLGIGQCKLLMVVDQEAAEKYGGRLTTRNGNLVRSAASHVILTRRFMQKIGKMGGKRRVANQSSRRRKASARHAAIIRWDRVRAAVAQPAARAPRVRAPRCD